MTIDPLIGQPIYAGYVVERKLGEGGMGAVYLAEDSELGKRIAVKVLLARFSEHREVVQRFTNEAKAAARLAHPHIIDIAAAGQLEDGRHYIAMEYLEGRNLGDYLHDWKRLGTEAALEILIQVCSALSLAHEKHIVHRDLKPDNVFVTQPPVGISWPGYGVPFVKLLDFGIAKLGDPKLAGNIKTNTHQVLGTPLYMSPEQARGLTDVDHRADIYSLGVIAYKMLTGDVPFKGHSFADIVYHQTHTLPVDPRELVPELPDVWATTILRSISAEPELRVPTVHEFARTLWSAKAEHTTLAISIAPGFANRVKPTDETRKAPSPNQAARTTGPTTLGQATTGAKPITQPMPHSRSRWLLAIAAVVALGLSGATIAALTAGDEPEATNTPTTETPPTRAARTTTVVDASVPNKITTTTTPKPPSQTQPPSQVRPKPKPKTTPPPAPPPTRVVITTRPAGGTVTVDSTPAQKAPITISLSPGQTIDIRAQLAGHSTTRKRIVIPRQKRFAIELKLKKRVPKPRPKPKSKPKPKPQTYDPNAPAGGF